MISHMYNSSLTPYIFILHIRESMSGVRPPRHDSLSFLIKNNQVLDPHSSPSYLQ